MRQRHSDYMHWAKTQSRARFNLATSGVGSFPLAELPDLPALEICGDSTYGYAPLQRAIAAKCGVDPDCVVAGAGTSMANHLAIASLIDPGDEVLIEQPAYELLVSTALFLGAEVKRFARSEENGYAARPGGGACGALAQDEADRAHQPAQPIECAHAGFRAARGRRSGAQRGRACACRRGLSGCSLRE
jgi:hypothetical protein